jgi:hypothetical protein
MATSSSSLSARPPIPYEVGLNINASEARFPLIVPSSTSVRELRENLRARPELAQQARGKVMRLIAAGRLLSDDTATLASLGLGDGTHIHVALTETAPPPDRAEGAGASASASATGASSSSSATGSATAPALGGFDRLRLIGLGDDDIAVLRSQFLPDVQAQTLPSLSRLQGETEAARLQRAEEVWMRSQPEDSDFAANIRPMIMARRSLWGAYFGGGGGAGAVPGRGVNRPGAPDFREEAWLRSEEGQAALAGGNENVRGPEDQRESAARWFGNSTSEGTASSFFLGLALGWMVGVLMLLFAVGPQTSRKFKVGVVTGVMVNIVTSIIIAVLDTSDGTSGNGGASLFPSSVEDVGAWTGDNTGIKTVDLNSLGKRIGG